MDRNNKLLVRFLVFANLATIILYMFPPIVRTNTNSIWVVGYLSLSVFLIYIGLRKGLAKGDKIIEKRFQILKASNSLTNFFFIFYALTALLRYAYLLGFAPFEISQMIGRLLIGIADPQLGYHLSLEKPISSVHWNTYFLISIIDQIFFVYFMVVWKTLNRFKKIVGVVFIFIEMFYWLGCGTNFGLIAMLTNIIFALLLLRRQKQTKRLNFKIVIPIVILLIAAIIVFSYNMNGRAGGDSDKALNSLMTQFAFKEDSFILQILPESLWPSYYYIYSYVCQGYEALGCAMDLPVTWTGFCGNNPALMSFVQFLTGYNPFNNSYMMLLEKASHIDSLVAWHSAYLWWANDFTIIGALLIVYLMSYLCGVAYMMSKEKGDTVSSVVFVVLANMILFLFANNTYLSNVFYSFMLIFPYWLLTRYFRVK